MTSDLTLEEHLAVPYVSSSYSAPDTSGTWKRIAEYPELGCRAAADSAVEAFALVDEQRISLIVTSYLDGEPIFVPRPPLPSLLSEGRRIVRDRVPSHG